MASINKVILIGNLGRDPEMRTIPNTGTRVATVSIATKDQWKDRQSGEMRDHTEWHTVVFFERLAEIVEQYLRKGSQVYVEGSLRTRKWQDQNGNDRYFTEIRAERMQMLGSRSSNNTYKSNENQTPSHSDSTSDHVSAFSQNKPTSQQSTQSAHNASVEFEDIDDDDIPF